MKICIIEDDDYKATDLSHALEDFIPNAEISIARSYREGASALQRDWDWIVLDMQLPLFEKNAQDKVYAFAGERLLRALQRSQRNVRVIVITQYTTFSELLDEVNFEDLIKRLTKSCPRVFWGAVHYAYGSPAWREELKNLIK